MSIAYGGDPWRWLSEIPLGVVRACNLRMPRLSAEDSLLWATRIGVGTGSFPDGTGGRIASQWRLMTDQGRPAREERTVAQVRAAGLKVFGPSAAQ